MKFLLFFALTGLLFNAFAQQNAEFYLLDGRRADPCVNIQKLSGNRPDCTPNSQQPAASNTYLIPILTKTTDYANTLVIYGNFFGTSQTTSLSLAPITSPDSCGNVDAAVTAITGIANTGSQLSFNPGGFFTSWISTAVSEAYPRALCWNAGGGWQWTGFHLAAVFGCDNAADPKAVTRCENKDATGFSDLTRRAIYSSQKTCCTAGAVQVQYKVGQCINPNFQSCCGAVAYVNGQMKCCNETVETISWVDGACPCYSTIDSAKRFVSQCPLGEWCCLPTKYNELVTPATATAPILATDPNKPGECYNPRTHRCCNTGFRYDPGSEQCCAVNGLQSLNVPCPCSSDNDCIYGGQTVSGNASLSFRLQDFACCIQTAPKPFEVVNARCDPYANFPAGTGHYSIQQCAGQCIDTRYQICCNGRACIRQYERCCNSTCCNRFTGTCQTGTLRKGSSRNNNWEVTQIYDTCTTVEQIDLIRAWWMFVLPTFLLLGTLLCLAIALVFAGRVEHSARRALEKGMLVAALINIMFATCTFFAPIYKYGVVIVLVGIFAIIASAARRKGVYIANIILQVVLFIYLIDPFHGNDYFNLANDRNQFGRTDPRAAGLWHATSKIWDYPDTCWDFYNGYFKFDPLIRDNVRWDEPNNSSFGYCSRGWVSALLVFDGFIIISTIVQFLLGIVALLLRTQKAAA